MKKPGARLRAGRLFLLAAGLLPFGGCITAGPDYTPPAIRTPDAWKARAGVTNGPADPAALSQWWTIFRDPVLDALLESARQNNLDLKQAEARLRQARAQRNLSRADQGPTVTAGASAGRAKGSEEMGSGQTHSSFSSGFDAVWELDLFGGKRRASESADASLQASGEAWRDVMVSLQADVALTYVDYRSAQARLAIIGTNLAAQVETYDITRWRNQASLVTQLDVDQARVSLEQTRAALPLLQNAMDQAEHQLSILLGEAPGSVKPRLDAGPALIPVASLELAAGVPADVLRQRPDVRAAERSLAAQTAQIGVAEAARYPDLTLSGSLGFEALTAGDLYTAGARTAQGVVKAGLTVFDAGRIRQAVAIQTAKQEEALAAYEGAVLVALKEVEDALSSCANERFRERALQEAEAAGKSAFQLARDRYASGLIDFQTVLNTQQSLLTVQNSLASSQADESSDLIRLYKALGGGWPLSGKVP